MPSDPPAKADVCQLCPGDCLDACFNDAIALAYDGGVFVNAKMCAGCGACIAVCPLGRIRLHEGVARFVARQPNDSDAVPSAPVQPE